MTETDYDNSHFALPDPDKPEQKPWNREGAKVAKEC
jgi:hypothetical protein